MRNLLIGLTVVLAVYAFVIRPAHTRRVADKGAGGAAGGTRKAINGYLGRADQIWQVIAVIAVLLLFRMDFSDDDTPAPANETAATTARALARAAA